MSNKNCVLCSKVVYAAESVVVNDAAWHKACFRCSVCSVKLTLQNYKKTDPKAADIYCHKCLPTHRPTITADSVENTRVKNKPKVGLINDQVRGELAGQKSAETTDSVGIGGRMNAPRQGIINEQIRGELAGVKTAVSNDSIEIQNRLNAPKVATVNEQVRVSDDMSGKTPAEARKAMEELAAKKQSTLTKADRDKYAGMSPQEAFQLRKKEREGDAPYATPSRPGVGEMTYSDPRTAALAAQQALELAAAKEAAIAAQRAAAIAKFSSSRPDAPNMPPPIPTSARPIVEDTYVNPEDVRADSDNIYEDVTQFEAKKQPDDLYMPLY